jgi:hypothetical protein
MIIIHVFVSIVVEEGIISKAMVDAFSNGRDGFLQDWKREFVNRRSGGFLAVFVYCVDRA